ERPKTSFVANFLGTATFITGTVTKIDGAFMHVDGTCPTVVYLDPQSNRIMPESGAEVTLAIRPEKIHLTRDATGRDNESSVIIEDIAYLGVASNYRVKRDDGLLFKLQQTHGQRDEMPLEWEEKGFVHFDPADVILLEG
ncbi:MAG: TOBE domain-containing protein, partial [Candidatus Puniceispirillum sp.]